MLQELLEFSLIYLVIGSLIAGYMGSKSNFNSLESYMRFLQSTVLVWWLVISIMLADFIANLLREEE